MLDIRFIRENPDAVQRAAQSKGYKSDINGLLNLDGQRRKLADKADELRRQRNVNAEKIKTGADGRSELIEHGQEIKKQLGEIEIQLEQADKDFWAALKTVPNMPLAGVPVGASEEENVVAKTWGQKPQFDFEPKNHWQIAESKGWIDKERAAKVAGARFVYLKGGLVLLEFALWQFALQKLTDETVLKQIAQTNSLSVSSKPFVPVLPPYVAKTSVYEATGRLNKEEQTYKLADDDLWLNASAEHTLAPMYLNEIIEEADLPLRYVGYTTAFRREAGSYGKDVEGMIRLHQFNKLEMECFNLSDNSLHEHMFLVAIQEYLMQQLGLPYRVLEKCTADIGFPNAKGVDIEVWLPGQNKYRETHTADFMGEFQAEGMKTRVRRSDGALEFAHTNDATAFSERPLIAIIENYQQADGSVVVPEVLRPYLGGRTSL